jgi:curli biogenesis system outer membrane secretion channel CsgG
MRHKSFFLVLVLLLWTSAEAANRKRIAVLNFDFSGVQQWWGGYNWDIGAGIADVVVDELVRDGSYSVIERKALDAILAEQNFSNSDRVNPNSAASIGRILGVDAILIGSITQFGAETKSTRIGGIGGSWGRLAGGKVGTSEGKATVVVNARLIDVETGEILGVAKGEGESKRSGLLLEGVGGGRGGFGGGGIDMRSSDFRDSILGEATAEAAQQLAGEVIDNRHRIPVKARVVEGLVAFAEDGLVILNVGSSAGVVEGMELRVERVTRTVKDPQTGRVLRELADEVARLRVTQVEADSAEATIISGSDIQVGDRVRSSQ